MCCPRGITNTPWCPMDSGLRSHEDDQPESWWRRCLASLRCRRESHGRRFLESIGIPAAAGRSGREGWCAGRLDQHCDDAYYAEPLLAHFQHLSVRQENIGPLVDLARPWRDAFLRPVLPAGLHRASRTSRSPAHAFTGGSNPPTDRALARFCRQAPAAEMVTTRATPMSRALQQIDIL